MFGNVDGSKKSEFLDKARLARQERASVKSEEQAIIKIQSLVRRFLVRRRLQREIRNEVDEFLKIPEDSEEEYVPSLKPALAVYRIIQKFMLVFDQTTDLQRHEHLCKHLLASMNSDNIKYAYVSMALSKDHVIRWIHQLKQILWRCCNYFHILKPESPRHMKMLTTCLHMLVSFTSTNGWPILKGSAGEALAVGLNQLCKNLMGYLTAQGLYPCLQALLIKGLCRAKPCLKSSSLSAIFLLAMRPLQAADFSDNLLGVFLLHILAVPAAISHLSLVANESLLQLVGQRLFTKALILLSGAHSSAVIGALQGSYAICLLGNLIQLGTTEMEGLVQSTSRFIIVVMRLLECCQLYVHQKKSNLTHWHPVLGWVSQGSQPMLHEAMPYVEKQLRLLWGSHMVRLLFDDLFSYTDQLEASEDPNTQQASHSKNLLKKALEKAGSRATADRVKLTSPVLATTCFTCSMYLATLRTLAQLRLDVLTGLSCDGLLLGRLWRLLSALGPADSGLRVLLELVATTTSGNTPQPPLQLLRLAADIASHVITILDDVEFYEQCKPFSRGQLLSITTLLNQFVFKVLWNGHIDAVTAMSNEVFVSVHTLLMILYERNSRRSYSSKDHWLIKDIKSSSFVAELEKHKKAAQLLIQIVPHIIPHKDRVILFRRNVCEEKSSLGLTESMLSSVHSTLITVHRSRIIEDGYRQLAMLPPTALKGIIRVKFINEQGLDEAGIDQDGVFKEFLEETIKRVFDPSLNLFKVTAEQKLYPSPISYIQDNHLALFEFVGKMLAKAVYEGIVVEVPFAPFFLSEILGHQNCATYSSIDELPSLDAELYKNLTYIKRCGDEVNDLGLTFSYDEDVMGKLVSHELVPGGNTIAVTSDNKISYVHLMAHFKMRVQTREQTTAFLRGFRSIVNSDWLAMFSTPELQKLVSGDTMDIDLDDLRRHTHYYGGFHNNHKVMVWLWSVLSSDFTVHERGLFLRFVTSCSKPPLLGFANLEPPFSIRCVEVSDEQDMGDTVGSVLKGFFNIRKRGPVGRLPTSSTCFNLLKLPNYQKKATLRDKLRYAISSATGFELS